MKLDALIAFTQASYPAYRNMKSYFTSKPIEHNKNNYYMALPHKDWELPNSRI